MANSTTVDSGEETDNINKVKNKFCEICRTLKIDESIATQGWNDFKIINGNVTLEGEELHWLVCSLYVSIQKASLKREQSAVNGIPLSKLLSSVKLSLLHFFQKVRKWLDMGRYGAAINKKVEQLERNFSVSSIVFEKYSVIYKHIFNENHSEVFKRGRKKQTITTKDIFEFCWMLYIRTKTQYPDVTDDLVNSYHLLLCCLDFVFTNVLSTKGLKPFIDQDFSGAPANFLKEDLSNSDIPSIIDVLCQLYEGLAMETKIIRKQYLGLFVEDLIKNEKIKANSDSKTGLLDISNFEFNLKYLNDSYEEHILQVGDFDERIFIKEDSLNQIGTPTRRVTAFTDVDERERIQNKLNVSIGPVKFCTQIKKAHCGSLVKKNLQEHFNKVKGFPPQTPLTGRQWLEAKETLGPATTSITTAISRLQELVSGLKPSPSENLSKIFQEFKINPEEKINDELNKLSSIFLDEYTKPTKDSPTCQYTNIDFAKARLNLGKILFCKTLEGFLENEKKKSGVDLSALFEHDIFVKSLFCCTLEIVIYSYNTSTRVFPWILKVFKLKPYHFFKIIELVIRGEELSRDVIKHLSRIEEQILESLSWKSGSPIYSAITAHGVPRCQDVSSDSGVMTPFIFVSPTTLRMGKDSLQNSPKVSTQQNNVTPASPARRNLFGNLTPTKSNELAPTTPSSSGGQQTSKSVLLTPRTSGNSSPMPSVRFPIMLTSPGSSPVRLFAVTPNRGSPARPGIIRIQASPNKASSKRFGSLGIFFRKLYHMSSLRLKDLCEKLEIGSDMHKKIWTCFEHSVVENINMLCDRHIDQLLMCAVYVMGKVTKEDKSFHEIMKYYRTQPQATSDVYRRVLIEKASTESSSSNGASKQPATEEVEIKPENDGDVVMTEIKTNGDYDEEESDKNVYDDLIQFYNTVYIKKIKEFALKFASNKVTLDAPPLSPLPVSRKQVHSPRKVSKQHQVYISPIKQVVQMTPRSKMLYCFDSDSPKKLEEINKMIKGGTRRRVNLDDTDTETGPTIAKRPMNGLAKRAQELRQEQMSHRVLINNK